MQKSKILLTIAIILSFSLSFLSFTANASIPSKQQAILTKVSTKMSIYTPSSPIVITSDLDWATYASGGNGSPGNPWIIDNLYIDCSGTGLGISISGTDDFAIIENCFVNNSQVGVYAVTANNIVYLNDIVNRSSSIGFVIKACNNTMINCTTIENGIGNQFIIDNCSNVNVLGSRFVNASMGGTSSVWVTQGFGAGRSYNITFDNCTFQTQIANSTDFLLYITSTTNLTINKCSFENASSLGLMGSDPNYNVMINGSIFRDFGDYGIRASDVGNATIENCDLNAARNRTHNFAVTLHNDVDVTVKSCAITGYFLTAIEGSTNTNIAYLDNVIARSEYSQGPGPQNNNFASGVESGYVDYITIRGNWFYNCSPAIAIIDGVDPIVTGNYFHDHLNDLGGKALYGGTSIYTWSGNFYKDYFTYYPFANLKNVSTNVLNQTYNQHGINDTIPRYYANWFMRNQIVYLNFYSNVDGLGIPFTNLVVKVDNKQIASANPTILHVLFRLTAYDYKGRLLYDAMLNLNLTGVNINIGLNIAVQIFVSFYSSIDLLGIEFSTVKLYIDNVRYTRYDPIMDIMSINITVKNFANLTLYTQIVNLQTSGVYLDIGLPITTLTVHNNFDFGVIFHYSINKIDTSFPLAVGEYFDMRIALGTYKWWITNASNGALLAPFKNNVTQINFKTVVGPATIDFGWVKATTGPIDVWSIMAGYIVFFAVIIAVFAVVLGLMIRSNAAKKTKTAREYTEREHVTSR